MKAKDNCRMKNVKKSESKFADRLKVLVIPIITIKTPRWIIFGCTAFSSPS